MGETLFIRLGSQAESRIHWLIKTNGQEDIIASGELPNAGELTQLTEKSTTRDVVVFVPASDIAIKRLKVPGSSQRATRAAAPYMLEEMLAQDVEEMCFAFSETKQDDQGHNCFVAALERKQLDTWLQWLAEAEIFSKVLIPDALALPVEPNISSAVMLGEQVLIRLGEWQVMSFEANAWPVVANYFQGLSEDSQVINAYSALSEVPADLTIEYLPEDLPLAILANNHSRKFNLLQGEFQVKEKRSADTVNWLWVAGIACLALVLNFGLKGAELYLSLIHISEPTRPY